MNRNTLLKSIITLVLLVLLPSMTTAATETITWIHTDHLGSPIAGRNAAGETTWEQAYAPWGEKQAVAGVPQAPAGVGYTGHVYDEQVGLIYAGARWYDPETGRFLSPDAVRFHIEDVAHFNRYVYVNNNPLVLVDPNGNDSYLVSRPLSFTSKANHNFIVTHAEYPGDPNARIYSYGDMGNDTMGPVSENTKGFSEGTLDTDRRYWSSLSAEGGGATFRKINSEDDNVRKIAESVKGGMEYSAVPEVAGGVNSNSAAGAVAKKADGGSPRVDNGIRQPGANAADKVKFSEQ